jgi:hypothetical protein
MRSEPAEVERHNCGFAGPLTAKVLKNVHPTEKTGTSP